MTDTTTLTRAADHPTFTDKTWADVDGGYLTPERAERAGLRNWTAQHDLAVQLAERTDMPFEWARELVSAAASGMPLVVTWENVQHGYAQDAVHRTTNTVLVTSLGPTGLAHVRSWGFGHPIYASQLRDVRAPEAEYSFEIRDN